MLPLSIRILEVSIRKKINRKNLLIKETFAKSLRSCDQISIKIRYFELNLSKQILFQTQILPIQLKTIRNHETNFQKINLYLHVFSQKKHFNLENTNYYQKFNPFFNFTKKGKRERKIKSSLPLGYRNKKERIFFKLLQLNHTAIFSVAEQNNIKYRIKLKIEKFFLSRLSASHIE